jgi:DNA-binding response OmpR family regulator
MTKTNKINKKILIVEDDKDFLFILQKRFSSEGLSVITAKDGEEGLSMAEEEKPDLILLDILLPKMDGIAMANKLKESNNNTPIIFLTNVKDVGYTNESIKSGEWEYLIKSDLHIDDIVAKVKSKLGL